MLFSAKRVFTGLGKKHVLFVSVVGSDFIVFVGNGRKVECHKTAAAHRSSSDQVATEALHLVVDGIVKGHSNRTTMCVTSCKIHPFRNGPVLREGTNMAPFDVTGEGAQSPISLALSGETSHKKWQCNGPVISKCEIQRETCALISDGREVGRQRRRRVRVRYPYTTGTNWDTRLP